ncbi:MAG: zinc ribbon domain-containing protein [Anaerolineae bacterium]|uniref:FmdB family zinc ribbon protein n=1 Tax=Candidatus Flexifilum breve TaxID=3140694 RepID=UPI001AC1BABD|nr:zinc ribbon domain-containing protein [Chloroflexota bacterium]MBK9748039.1 zinc ribbon domain-containing protein [Chloroflexota bacterium]MBN8633678.1 zinc ribbon domain-containing protein [Anaerolineae bacterium]
MPIYEYDCPGCGRTFEKRVPMSQADAVECPNCGSKYPQRKLSRIAIKGHVSVSSAPAPAPGGG